jgi:4-diphosphocytidyl-2-C-methyl-D-erythritol kinase
MLRLRAPAKLNLYLRVLGRRPDGYHELETLFERIDLADELTFEPAATLSLTCSEPSLSCGEDNLVLQAARLLQRKTNTVAGARIHLEKRIPVSAGLGGGSSDAAAAMLGLNRLWESELSQSRLVELAGRLGSDVPFFLSPEPFATGRGRGERCEGVGSSVRLAHVLVVPPERLSTKEIYAGAHFDLTARKPSITIIAHALRNGSLGELAEGLWNDLEPEAIRRCPVIATIQAHLREYGCLGVLVSGSGSAVFGVCADGTQAHEVASRIRGRAPSAWRIETVHTEHPSRVVTPAFP